MISLLFLLTSPLNALHVKQKTQVMPENVGLENAPVIPLYAEKVQNESSPDHAISFFGEKFDRALPQLKLKFYPNGFVDVLNQTAPPKFSTESSEHVLRQMGEVHHNAWIVFVGDSNMRNTYWWWVNEQTKNGAAKLLKSHHFSSEDKWSDQEAILEYKDGFEVRTSYRFLHASENEFQFKTTHWHEAQKVPVPDNEDKKIMKLKRAENTTHDDPDAIAPSERALEAASRRKLINFEDETPIFAKRLNKFKESKPSAVLMTEGWGGIPGCERFDEVLDMFKRNAETSFVWSPMYVTTRTERRHRCFQDKIANLPAAKQNFKFVDMWDWTSQLPTHKANPHLKPGEWDGAFNYHVRVGGHFARTSLTRFMNALDLLSN